jgi:serine/threonine-protein kinase SRPK3
LEHTSLLDGIGPGRTEYSEEAHFAQMIGLLGPPPKELLDRADAEAYSKFYTAEGITNPSSIYRCLLTLCSSGEFKYPKMIPSDDFSFEKLVPFVDGEDKEMFISLASRMLRWIPEERATALELASDPWLYFEAPEKK